MVRVTIIIPTLNEERSIGKVIDDVPVADFLQNGLETVVYVIDGNSTDNTRGIAVDKAAKIILKEQAGTGSASSAYVKSFDRVTRCVIGASSKEHLSQLREAFS